MCTVRFACIMLTITSACHALLIFNVIHEQWNAFKEEYGKKYNDEAEEKSRLMIYMQNSNKIDKHNAKYQRGEFGYELAMNQFGDMAEKEYDDVALGSFDDTNIEFNISDLHSTGPISVSPQNVKIPDHMDWRERGAVTDVESEGNCSSGWAFSAAGSLEGQYFRKTGLLVPLSKQNLIDCSNNFGNRGCNGGRVLHAFRYIKANKGIDYEAAYPYEGKVMDCRFSSVSSVVTIKGFTFIERGDETRLKEAVATVGPISATITATQNFRHYKQGVFNDPHCKGKAPNQGVLIVGYGKTDKGEEYWLIRNSWGTKWGENGYMRLARNKSNQCSIATLALYPLV